MTTFELPDGRKVALIGDPHLGKDFDKHAPEARRGQRTTMQMAQFYDELRAPADIIVMVGDLFDHPRVGDGIVIGAAHAVRFMAEAWPDKTFIMMAGNHDVPRNLTSVGAWTKFTKILEDRQPNLHVVRRPAVIEDIAVFPWEWDRTALEQIEDVKDEKVLAAIGHWDLELFDGDGAHMAPTKELVSLFGDIGIYSGHFHTPGVYLVDGIDVVCTGSMQPISHGEDPNNNFYITVTLDELAEMQPEDYHDKHVRVLVKAGEEVPALNCLGVTHKRLVEETETHQGRISPADFDWNERLALRIAKLAKPVQEFIIERMPDADPQKQRRRSDGAGSESLRVGDTSEVAVQPST